ncbi:MAG: hypothetical protein IKK87_04360 [Bacteroidaceae bacterium]|nr:hypothetical protein [Bacteroidaceae bacterium]
MSLSSLAYRYLLRTFSGHELGGIHALDGAEAAGEVACVTYPKVAVHEDKRKRHIMSFIDEHPEYAKRIKGTKILFPPLMKLKRKK